MKLTGRNGILRISDATPILHGAGVFAAYTVDMVKFDGASAWTNITAELQADDTSYANDFLADLNDQVYIGSTVRFAKVKFLRGGGSNYAAGSGALIAKYWNGSAWVALEGVSDGTFTSPDCFAKDGYITFHVPHDWAATANVHNAALDAGKYYIQLMTTTSSTTDVDADVLCPAENQFFEVVFANMDFSGPLGRAKTPELLVLNRATMDSYAHYVEGSYQILFDPMNITFTALMDDTVNRVALKEALFCGNPASTYWTATGTSTKGNSMNDGVNVNAQFVDTTKKTVNIFMIWEAHRTAGIDIGNAFYEVFFEMKDMFIKEDDDGVTLNCAGLCYGKIEEIHDFGNRY